MEHDSTLYVGLDVHKDSITVAYALGAGEVELLGKIGTTKTDIDRLCKRLQSKARHICIVYEAGPCGYGLYRQLVQKGFDCMVCAPSLIPKKPGDRVKTDRRDAIKLVRSLRAGDLSAVYVPSVEDEAFRDLARAWVSAKDDLKRARQRLKAFLLLHGVRYAGRADWGPAHRRWLSAFAFDSVWQQLAFEEYRRTIEDRLAQCDRLEAALREAVVNWRFYPAVLGLQTMRGVQFTTAVGMLAELGDLSRFAHPRQLMAWLGVTPSEHSSGEKRRQGSITKNGNSLCKKAAGRSGLELPAPGPRESRDPAPPRRHPQAHRGSRLGRAGAPVPTLPEARRARQAEEHRGSRGRSRTQSVSSGTSASLPCRSPYGPRCARRDPHPEQLVNHVSSLRARVS